MSCHGRMIFLARNYEQESTNKNACFERYRVTTTCEKISRMFATTTAISMICVKKLKKKYIYIYIVAMTMRRKVWNDFNNEAALAFSPSEF